MRLFNNRLPDKKKVRKHVSTSLTIALASAGLLALSACQHDNDDDDDDTVAQATYEITVHNLTNGQPLTPLGVVIHESGYTAWELGTTVTTGLETLAESGDPAAFLTEADSDSNVRMTTNSTNGPFMPGTSETVSVTIDQSASLQLTVASMLANTNDAFTGVSNWTIGDLAVGESTSVMSHVFDAGTEANTETMATMPGPAAGGEGFNTARDDLDLLTVHRGVVTIDDGFATSILNESHRWLGQAAKVVVTRMQ